MRYNKLLRVTDIQERLFSSTPEEIANNIGLNWLTLTELSNWGYLSFKPKWNQELTESQEAELIFLGRLVVAGCDNRMLQLLLSELERPYCYLIEKMYFDWTQRRWCQLPKKEEELDPQDALEILLFCEDRDFLEDVIRQIKSCLINVDTEGDTELDQEGEKG